MCHWQIVARYLHFVLNLLISMLFYHCPCYFYTIFHPNPLPQLLSTPSESYLIRKLIFLWLWTWQICFDCVSSGWRFLKQISVWKPLLQIHSNQRYYSQYYLCERSNFVIERQPDKNAKNGMSSTVDDFVFQSEQKRDPWIVTHQKWYCFSRGRLNRKRPYRLDPNEWRSVVTTHKHLQACKSISKIARHRI